MPHFDQVGLTSFSRSGNSMLRAYLEKITGLATGSDGDLKKKMVADLMKDGLVGEGLCDARV